MGLSSFVSRVIPAAVGFVTGGPVGATTAILATEQAKKQERSIKRAVEQRQQQENKLRRDLMAMGSGEFGTPGLTFSTPPVQQPGFFDRLSGLASTVGSTLLTGLESAVPSLIQRQIFGSQRPQSAAQGPALTTITNVGAQESQGSGSIQAGAGTLLPSIIGGARSLLKSPAGQLALGAGAGGALSLMAPDGKKMRITRKMKSQARTVLNLAGGNISLAADILNISDEMLVQVLLKRFRNDGPVVTKAALRKTKSTIRRLHSMQDVLKSITPTAAGRRRAPMKRATTTTLIKN
jgi:gas vesicle protein